MKRGLSGDESDDSWANLVRDERQNPMGRVPLLPEEVEIDDQGASIVFIFPREEEEGGMVDPDEVKEDAMESFEKIFLKAPEYYGIKPPSFEGQVSEGEYQEAVRGTFLHILRKGGLQASSSPSIDQDEVFLRVSFDHESRRLQDIAEYYRYMMPVTDSSYDMKENDAGHTVPVFTEYSQAVKHISEPFRQVDETRLIMRWLGDQVCIEEMISQGIVTRYFPAANYNDIIRLSKCWANVKWVPCLASAQDLEHVRNYFGEQICFFFSWFGTYNKYLFALFVGAAACSFRHGLAAACGKWVLNAFAVFLVGWVAMFNELFKRRSARLKQRWGMKDWDSQQATTLPEYQPELDGTRQGSMWKTAANACVALYVLVFAGAILGISLVNKDMRDAGDMRLAHWSPLLISILMKVASFTWSKIAIKLVHWENHRTEARFNDSLAWTLASVKLFVALFPFVQLAFLESWVNQTCKPTIQEAVVSVYKHSGFPAGTPLYTIQPPLQDSLASNITKDDLGFLEDFRHVNRIGGQCIYGCYPSTCWEETVRGVTKQVCTTNCWLSLQEQLITFYILQVVASLVFLIIPIILTKVSVTLEIAKVEQVPRIPALIRSFLFMGITGRSGGSSSSDRGSSYSFLQFQAKCHESSPYEYASWGGSFVEDFLDLAIGYSLLACFAQVVPEMALIGTASHMIMYRILAFRMLNVTCRPWPNGAEGIGIWQNILDTIATLAVTCNVALATFLMPPIKFWPQNHKLMFFILAEKGLFSLRALVNSFLEDVPADVVRIDDHNAEVEKSLTERHLEHVDEMCNLDNVDIGLSAQE